MIHYAFLIRGSICWNDKFFFGPWLYFVVIEFFFHLWKVYRNKKTTTTTKAKSNERKTKLVLEGNRWIVLLIWEYNARNYRPYDFNFNYSTNSALKRNGFLKIRKWNVTPCHECHLMFVTVAIEHIHDTKTRKIRINVEFQSEIGRVNNEQIQSENNCKLKYIVVIYVQWPSPWTLKCHQA